MRYFIITTLCFIFSYTHSQTTLIWEKEIGGGEDDWGYSLCKSDEGFVFTGVTSSYDEEVTDSLGGTDIWLGHISTDSTMIWSHTFGGTDNDRGNAVCRTPDGGYILTGFSSSNDIDVSGSNGNKDLVVIKTNANGEKEWSRLYGGASDDLGNSIIANPDGTYMVAGTTFSANGDISNNLGIADYWILKLDAVGNLIWEKTYAGSGEDRAKKIIPTQDGNFLILGTSFSDDMDVTDHWGGVDFWLLKINGNGQTIWSKSLGGTSADQGFDVLETSWGEIIVVGEVLSNDGHVVGNHGLTDAWIAKLSSNGDLIWQNTLGGSMVDYFLAVKEADDGSFIATGNTFSDNGDVSQNLGASDIWLVKISSNGILEWEVSLGYDLNEIGNDLVVYDNRIALIGGIQVDHLSRHGNSDVYIMLLRSPLTSVIPIQQGMSIKVYPNPSFDDIRIQHEKRILKYSIFNSQGQVVKTGYPNEKETEIPIQKIRIGNYFLHIISEDKTEYSIPITIIK